MKHTILLLALLFSLSGCIGTVVGAAADVAIEVVKVPFKVGGAVVDAVSGDDEEEEKEKD
jgi:predicted small secreted protein